MNRSSRSKPSRYAVVGLGHIAQAAILPGFRRAKSCELVAIVSEDEAKRKKLARKYKLDHAYSYDEYDRALEVVDAVYIALPNHLHKDYAVRAAATGVHVLCEKPMAVTAAECEAMIGAARQHNVKLMIAYRLHFEKSNLEAVRLIKTGKLGDVRVFSSEFGQQVVGDNVRVTASTSEGGGPVYDMGIYCINATRYLFHEEPTHVFACSANNGDARFRKTEEMMSVVLHFPKERLASFTCSFGVADVSRYSVHGTKGTLTAEPAYDYSIPLKHRLTIGNRTKTRSFPKRDQFAAEMDYFSNCILENKEPEPSGEEGLADIRIVEAIYESARTGQVVEVGHLPAKKRPSSKQEINRPGHSKTSLVHAKSASGE